MSFMALPEAFLIKQQLEVDRFLQVYSPNLALNIDGHIASWSCELQCNKWLGARNFTGAWIIKARKT